MKKILFFFAVLCAIGLNGQAQKKPGYTTDPTWKQFRRIAIDDLIILPTDTLSTADTNSIAIKDGILYLKYGIWQMAGSNVDTASLIQARNAVTRNGGYFEWGGALNDSTNIETDGNDVVFTYGGDPRVKINSGELGQGTISLYFEGYEHIIRGADQVVETHSPFHIINNIPEAGGSSVLTIAGTSEQTGSMIYVKTVSAFEDTLFSIAPDSTGYLLGKFRFDGLGGDVLLGENDNGGAIVQFIGSAGASYGIQINNNETFQVYDLPRVTDSTGIDIMGLRRSDSAWVKVPSDIIGGGVSVPTLQQVISAGATMVSENIVNLDGFAIRFNGGPFFNYDSTATQVGKRDFNDGSDYTFYTPILGDTVVNVQMNVIDGLKAQVTDGTETHIFQVNGNGIFSQGLVFNDAATLRGLALDTTNGKWYTVPVGGVNTNFANADLTFTDDRTHDLDGKSLTINDARSLDINLALNAGTGKLLIAPDDTNNKISLFTKSEFGTIVESGFEAVSGYSMIYGVVDGDTSRVTVNGNGNISFKGLDYNFYEVEVLTDTAVNKPAVFDEDGNLKKLHYWPVGAGESSATVGTYSTRVGLSPSNGDEFFQTDDGRDGPAGKYYYLNSEWHYVNENQEQLKWMFNDLSSSTGNNNLSTELLQLTTGGAITSTHYGLKASTSTSASARVLLMTGSNGNPVGWALLSDGVAYYKIHILDIPALSTGTEEYSLRVGFGDASAGADFNNGLYIEYDRTASTNWRYASAAAATRTKTNSSVAVTTGAHTLEILYTPSNGTAEYWVDGTSLGTINTNIPTLPVGLNFQLVKSNGTTPSIIDIDYLKAWQRLTTSRD